MLKLCDSETRVRAYFLKVEPFELDLTQAEKICMFAVIRPSLLNSTNPNFFLRPSAKNYG